MHAYVQGKEGILNNETTAVSMGVRGENLMESFGRPGSDLFLRTHGRSFFFSRKTPDCTLASSSN
jgi:hypothetical protein